MNSANPALMSPSTPSTRLWTVCGSTRLKAATAMVHNARIKSHNSSDPSCAPQTAAIR